MAPKVDTLKRGEITRNSYLLQEVSTLPWRKYDARRTLTPKSQTPRAYIKTTSYVPLTI